MLPDGLVLRGRSAFWQLAPPSGKVLHERSIQPLLGADGWLEPGTDARIVETLRAQTGDVYPEYLVELDGGCLIEPSRGWAVQGLNRLVPSSLPYAKLAHAPYVARYLTKRATYGLRPRRVEAVVSLRDKYETNYWHVLNDVLPRLFVLESQGIDPETPLVVAGALFEQPYFQAMLARSGLDRRTWIVQDGRLHLRPERAYFCRPLRYCKDYFERLLRLMRVEPAEGPGRQLFVTRRHRYRSLTNLDEIERIAVAAGFEVVDPGELSFDEQVDLFAAARRVVGIHGAGMANLVFRAGGELDVLELLPANWIEPMYCWVSHVFGFRYRAVVGEPTVDHEFGISPQQFERELEALLQGSNGRVD